MGQIRKQLKDWRNKVMPLSQDVVDRLLVAKGLLAKIRFLPVAHPDRISLAQAILTAHNATELALAAVATHLGKLPKQAYLLEYFPAIKEVHPDQSVAGHEYFRQLNNVRIAIKHHGNFPEPHQWYRVGERTYEYVSEWCQRYLGLSLDELDESALIANKEVKEFYDKAMGAFQRKQYKESLEHLAYATEALFRSNQALRNLGVGKARAEDAIKLAAFGVHANNYLALQEFLPSLVYDRDHSWVVKWDQKRYGHPGNWTRDEAEFSLKKFVDVALRIQDADFIPGAIEFDVLYDHKITALDDGVEIVQEKAGVGLPSIPFRAVVKTLKKGESIRCHVSPKSPGDLLAALLGIETKNPILSIVNRDEHLWGEVEADKVRITCVPKDNEIVRKYFPDLPEVEYEP